MQSFKIKKYLAEAGEIKEGYQALMQSIRQGLIEESLIYLHLMVLMTQGPNKIKVLIESEMDSNELLTNLFALNIDCNDQLFILRCLLELSSD